MKQHLVECMLVHSSHYSQLSMNLSEASQKVEGTDYKALAVYRFRFTRPDEENVNGRIYSTALWTRIIKDFVSGRTTHGLMDHPAQGAGSPKDIWCVWRNMNFSDNGKTVSADCYILDNEWGRTALGVLEAGGEIGLSTSGYGEFLRDGKTVDPETYDLERVADFVEDPSYRIFGQMEDRVMPATPSTSIQEGATSHGGTPVKEHTMKMSLREQNSFRITMKQIYEEVRSLKDPRERKVRAQEAINFYEDDEFVPYKDDFTQVVTGADTEVDSLIADAEKLTSVQQTAAEVSTALETAKTDIENLQAQVAELTEKYECATAMLDEAVLLHKENATLIESITSEKNGKVSVEAYQKMKRYAEDASKLYVSLKKNHEKLREANENLSSRLRSLTEEEINRKKALQSQQEATKKLADDKAIRERVLNARSASLKEKTLLENANPEVLRYYESLVAEDPEFASLREAILGKKLLSEAEFFVLQNRKPSRKVESVGDRDLSQSLSGIGINVDRPIRMGQGYL